MGMRVESERRGAAVPEQAGRMRAGAWLALGLLLLPAGCGGSVERFYESKLPFDTPIDWWHQLQGGVIAEERPPPPGVGDPYPNFGAVPAKPTPPDAVVRSALSARLAGERDRAERAAAQDPFPTPAPARPAVTAVATAGPTPVTAGATPAATGATTGTTAAPAGAAAAPVAPTARFEAAEAKPLAPAAPGPVAPPASASLQAAAASTSPPRQPAPGAPVVSGPVPALPTAPPPLPAITGIPAATTAPAIPKAAPQVDAVFVEGSAVLRPESDAALRQLAARRGSGGVAVLGGGDARSALPDAQAEALPLAWRRARVLQDVLRGAGVPAAAMHVDAAALARGGIVRLLD